ncbi:MAG: membrane protein insertion efficiency factor YidD [Acidimicrobiia bacterium]|nr:membrane protein insertion efficiency factor YidD [bacterium]MXW69267.1 membrane protein insertion efficiency factor YidD [Acidimicrobiia bacterium]MDE0674888.1 membrane protein insertion efficiency factor YidD [bacterium]MXX01765.1 membrane protein insertion efficiency factor YidD [Acidimicrobiia bacterium]MXX45669.1 membrane protein insertion efficiency factor YidD [Acidimicrobiia bacterium]
MRAQPEQRTSGRSARLLLGALKLYQERISPNLGRRCRYLPTCSAYARTAVERFGVTRGVVLTVRRLLRCQPFGSSGYDPVPVPAGGVETC